MAGGDVKNLEGHSSRIGCTEFQLSCTGTDESILTASKPVRDLYAILKSGSLSVLKLEQPQRRWEVERLCREMAFGLRDVLVFE
jgi:hypothetical protein